MSDIGDELWNINFAMGLVFEWHGPNKNVLLFALSFQGKVCSGNISELRCCTDFQKWLMPWKNKKEIY